MSNNAIATVPTMDAALMEKAVVEGDLSKMSSAERLDFYRAVCMSLGLNPATRPFGYIRFDNSLQLYAKKDAAEQLRKIYGVSITRIEKRLENDIYTVTAYAQTRDGRMDVDEGAVSVHNLRGLALANAYKKAVTQAKRRVTLSICGLGFLDETETEDVPRSQIVEVNHETGEIVDPPRAAAQPPRPQRQQARPSAAPAPPAPTVDQETGEIVDGEFTEPPPSPGDSWQEFNAWAKSLGYRNRSEVKAALGDAYVPDMTPDQMYEALAAVVERELNPSDEELGWTEGES